MGVIRWIAGRFSSRAIEQAPPTEMGSLSAFSAWQDSGRVGVHTAAGVDVNPDTAMAVSAVHACVRVLSEDVASLPCKVYRKGPDTREELPNHPLSVLLGVSPNRDQTPCEFFEDIMGCVLLRGRAFVQIVRSNAGQILELVPLAAHRMEIKADENGRPHFWYRPEPLGAQPVELQREELWIVQNFQGKSPIRLAAEQVAHAAALEEFGSRFFSNFGRPGGVIECPGKLTPEAEKRFVASWNAAYAGPQNAHKLAVLYEGMKWARTSIEPEAAQFLESRRFSVEEIARIFRMPPHKIGELSRATFSNIEHQGIDYERSTLRPWLVRIEQSARRDLLSDTDRASVFVAFNSDAILRGDLMTRYQAHSIARQNGWLSVNDIRRIENMNPIEGGDTYAVPLNLGSATPQPEPDTGDKPSPEEVPPRA